MNKTRERQTNSEDFYPVLLFSWKKKNLACILLSYNQFRWKYAGVGSHSYGLCV